MDTNGKFPFFGSGIMLTLTAFCKLGGKLPIVRSVSEQIAPGRTFAVSSPLPKGTPPNEYLNFFLKGAKRAKALKVPWPYSLGACKLNHQMVRNKDASGDGAFAPRAYTAPTSAIMPYPA